MIVDYVGNDTALPNFLTRRVDTFSLTRSYLVNFVLERMRGSPYLEITDAPRKAGGTAFLDEPGEVPEQ